MTQLRDIQQRMIAYLTKDEQVSLDDLIVPNQKLTQSPLDIYRSSITGNHLNAFADVYPVVRRLVGETFFEYAFKHFRKDVPNIHYDLSRYGEGFADFLQSFKPCANLRYLPDIAQLEWFCHKTCLGSQNPSLDLEALAQVPEAQQGNIVFELPKHSYLISSVFPILKIWEVNQPDYVGDQTVNLDEAGDSLFVYRRQLDLCIMKLDDIDHVCLKSLQDKQPLKKMFYVLIKDLNISEEKCQNILAKLIQRGWLVGFTVLE